MEFKITLCSEAQSVYLDKLKSRILKILHLIEEEKITGYSPVTYIIDQLFEIRSANDLLNNKLIDVIVKLNGICREYDNLTFVQIRKQILEIRKIINNIQKEVERG